MASRHWACAAAALAMLAALPVQAQQHRTAVAALKTPTGDNAGSVTMVEGPKGVLVRVEATGLPPGWHGLHFHEVGDCSKTDFTSAGAHVHGKPGAVHGLLNPDANEAGDLPNLYVDAAGVGAAEIHATLVALNPTEGRANLLDADGSAIVIHANPDDYKTQPIGGAGARIACGVLK